MRSHYGRTAVIAGVAACWTIYDVATAAEAPRQAVAILQYTLLGMALIGVAGCAVMYFRGD
jgi:hypothetical protein